MARIELRSISKTYDGDIPALNPTNLEVEDGKLLVLVGPSGCGKSTLLRVIAGLETPTGGDVLIDGNLVTHLPPKNRDVAMVFQSYALYPHMTVAENIGFGLKLRKVPRETIVEKVQEAASMLGLESLLGRKPKALSGGQRQRVALGRALVREPKVFLLDEPLSNLDAALRVEMRSEIRRLHRRLGATMIYVTHDQVEAMTLADTLVVMRDGGILQCASPEDIYASPANDFVATFIGSPPMNTFPGTISDSCFTGDGFSLAVSSGFPPSGNIRLGIRPEHLTLQGEEGPIPFEVGHVEILGHATLVHGRVSQGAVVVRVPAGVQLNPGDTLRLDVSREHMHWFHADTGKRLGDGGEV